MNTTTNRAVFLDFDGVLFDTVREAYAVTMIALGRSIRVVDIDFDSEHFERFNHFRYLVGPAWNYYDLTQSIENETGRSTIDLELEYKKSLEQQAQGEHRSFEENFFQARTRLREADYNGWLSLIFSYNVIEGIRRLMKGFIFISGKILPLD